MQFGKTTLRRSQSFCLKICLERIVVDGGPENKQISERLISHYKIKRTLVSAYRPQANGLVEWGHQAILNATAKYCNDPSKQDWPNLLHLTLWVDRITIQQ